MDELNKKINETLQLLKIKDELKKHPAFIDYIENMIKKIYQIGLSNPNKINNIKGELGKISFEIGEPPTKCELTIINESESSIKYIIGEKQPETYDVKGKTIRKKNATEEKIEIDNLNQVTVTSLYSELNTANGNDKEYSEYSGAEQKKYDQNGIMLTRIIDQYQTQKKPLFYFDKIMPQDMLYNVRNLFTIAQPIQRISRTIIQRNKDIRLANVTQIKDEKSNIITEKWVTALNTEHGIKDMNPQHQIDPHSVQPLTQEEIEQLINQEKNEIIKEGIKQYFSEQERINTGRRI